MSLTNEEIREINQAFDFVIQYFKDTTAQQYFFENKDVALACILKMRICPVARFIPLFGPKNHTQPVWPHAEAEQAFAVFCKCLTKLNDYYMQADPFYQRSFKNKANEEDIKEAVTLIELLIANHRKVLMDKIPNPDSELCLANNSMVNYGELIKKFNSRFANDQTKEAAQDYKISPSYNTPTITYSLS